MEAVSAIHTITLKTIMPAIEKGTSHRVQSIAKFLEAQSRVHGTVRIEPLGDNSLPPLCVLCNSDVPLRPFAGVPPAPFLSLNTCPSSSSNIFK